MSAGQRRILVVTAVAAERDAAARGLAAGTPGTRPTDGQQVPLPGGLTLRRTTLTAPPPPGAQPPAVAVRLRVDLLAAGVGPAAAAASTAVALTAAALAGQPYALVVSAGVAGGFAPLAPVGTVLLADPIVAADLGAQGPAGFLPVDTLGFGTSVRRTAHPLTGALTRALGAVSGPLLTVSTATGTADTADELAARHPGAVGEAMEGFGVAEAAAGQGVPVVELRAVSNPVGPRDRDAWRLDVALDALAGAFAALPGQLAGPDAVTPAADADGEPSTRSPG